MERFDLSYLTSDSLSEGVGSSQIVPLIYNLAKIGLRINLISYEKSKPNTDYETQFLNRGISWTPLKFDPHSSFGPFKRIMELRKSVENSSVIHARSDIPAASGILSNNGPVLWDIRSLWSDQRQFIETNFAKRQVVRASKAIEYFNAHGASAISTLTAAVVPILEHRHKNLTPIRTVVSTFVDLDRFSFTPKMPEKLTALFSGTYNRYYDLGLSGRFIQALKMIAPVDVHWARPYESSILSLGVGESRIIEVEQNQMPGIISDSSFGVSICRNDAGLSLTAAAPTKIAEFLATGRPVVVNSGLGDFDSLINSYRAGVILDGTEDNTVQGANKMFEIIQDPETPARCRSLAEKHFNLDNGTDKYLKIYERLRLLN